MARIKTWNGRYHVNAAAALAYGLDARENYNAVKGTEHKRGGRWYVTLIDRAGDCYEEIPRYVLLDRLQEAREARLQARQEAERQARELERRTVVGHGGRRVTLAELRQDAKRCAAEGGYEGVSPVDMLALLDRIETLLDEIDNSDY